MPTHRLAAASMLWELQASEKVTTMKPMTQSAQSPATVYYASWCPYCQRLLQSLDASGTIVDLVDVESDEQASEWVKSVNNGNRVVPTVRYSDGTTATNPSADEVCAKLKELGA